LALYEKVPDPACQEAAEAGVSENVRQAISGSTGVVFREAAFYYDNQYFNGLEDAWRAEHKAVVPIIHDIAGNPFRPLPRRTFPAAVLGLARSCCDAFPVVSPDYRVLADAMDELGESEVASHC